MVKNYKALCGLLEEKITDGNGKKAQLQEWQRYFEFERAGHKFIIKKVYDNPLPKAIHENSIYIKAIELLLMAELAKRPGNRCVLSKTQLFSMLGMINDRYYANKRNRTAKELKQYDEWQVSHFYGRANHKLSQILFSALNSMKRRCLIDYEEKMVIIEKLEMPVEDVYVKGSHSSSGDDSDDSDGEVYQGKSQIEYLHRFATAREKKDILDVQQMVLNEMGKDKIPFNNVDEFYARVNQKLNEIYGWSYVYKEYEIIYSKTYMEQDIEIVKQEIKDKLQQSKTELNSNIIDALSKQAERLLQKNRSHEEWGCNTKYVYPYDYLEVQNDLAEFLLRIK